LVCSGFEHPDLRCIVTSVTTLGLHT